MYTAVVNLAAEEVCAKANRVVTCLLQIVRVRWRNRINSAEFWALIFGNQIEFMFPLSFCTVESAHQFYFLRKNYHSFHLEPLVLFQPMFIVHLSIPRLSGLNYLQLLIRRFSPLTFYSCLLSLASYEHWAPSARCHVYPGQSVRLGWVTGRSGSHLVRGDWYSCCQSSGLRGCYATPKPLHPHLSFQSTICDACNRLKPDRILASHSGRMRFYRHLSPSYPFIYCTYWRFNCFQQSISLLHRCFL